jgi:peptidoglycan/xylan/chitin deacetylase (PgdA/CDA1 family)
MSFVQTAFSRSRALLRVLRRRAVILSYHRIAEVDVDPWDLAVRPDHFAEQLEVLHRLGRPLSVRDLLRSMTGGGIPQRAVVVTFDDGYADNLLRAKPLLERSGVPATVFLTAGILDASQSFWWERLTAIFLTAGRLPGSLEVEIGGNVHRWTLGGASEYSAEEARRDRGWRGWHREEPTARHCIYLDLYRLLQPMREAAREPLLAALQSWAGRGSVPELQAARALSHREAALLATERLIEVGAHTMTHPRLSALNDAEKAEEIHQSRKTLEEIVGQSVTSFAYPYGQPGDYDEQSVAIVRQAGFTVACANVPGPVTRGSNVFELPRFHVSDWNGDVFERNLVSWLNAA